MNASLAAKPNLVPARNARRALWLAGIVLCVLAFFALFLSNQHATKPAKALTGDKAVAQLQKNGQYSSLMKAVEAARYAVTPVKSRAASAEFFAFNPAQKFSARFQDGGVKLSSSGDKSNDPKALQVLAGAKARRASAKSAAWNWNLKLRAYGYGDNLQNVDATAVKATSVGGDSSRVEYQRGAVTEWFVNARDGLEQGFTVHQRPAGDFSATHSDKPLRVALSVASDLKAHKIAGEKNGGVAFSDQSGATVLTYRKLRAWDAKKRDLPAQMELETGANGRSEIVLAVADAGAAYPITIDPVMATQEYKLVAPTPDGGGKPGDSFGVAVALDGVTALISASGDSTAAGSKTGSAYIFVRSGATWSLQAQLLASDAAAEDRFGTAVALDGDTALIGAGYDDNVNGTDAGAAYVFVRSGTAWSQQQKIVIDNGTPEDGVGFAVALSGDTLAINAFNSGTPTMSIPNGAGSVYVYVRSGAAWTAQAHLFADVPTQFQSFGSRLALEGNTLVAVSNKKNVSGSSTDAGKAYVFVRSGTTWSVQDRLFAPESATAGGQRLDSVALDGDTVLFGTIRAGNGTEQQLGAANVFVRSGMTWALQATLTNINGAPNDNFGLSVALDGDTALIGAPEEDGNAGQDVGAAYVFVRSGTTWSRQARLSLDDGAQVDQFGAAVALLGDTALVGAPNFVGAPGLFPPVGAKPGLANIFVRSGSDWNLQQQISIQNAPGGAMAGDLFGSSVAIDGNTAVVGVNNDGARPGSAYVFVRNGNQWNVQATFTSGTKSNSDALGLSVAVAGDTVVIGARASTFVFVRNGTTWTQQTVLTAGDAPTGGLGFGSAVAIAGDTVLVGAPSDDPGTGANTGSAYVFVRSGGTWTQTTKLLADDGAADDNFGYRVALSSNGALISATGDDTTSTDTGSAYVFVGSGANWTQQARLVASDAATNDFFGSAVAISGDTALVGASGRTSFKGAAYVFVRSGGTWTQQSQLIAADGLSSQSFGAAVALQGDLALVGASGAQTAAGSYAGAVYGFTRNNTAWDAGTKVIANDSAASANFGSAVAISGDRAVVGAPSATTDAGPYAGAAYIFTLAGINGPPTISDIPDQSTFEDTPITVNFTVGDAQVAPGTLTVTATSSNTTLLPNTNLVFGGSGANRTLLLTPAANRNGTTTITVTVSNGTATASDTFVLQVLAVNDAPTFTLSGNQTVNQNSGARVVTGFITGISAGGSDESGQTLTFFVTTDNPALFSSQPTIEANGTLRFTPAPNAIGVAVVTVVLRDNGGTANNGVDTSVARTFTIRINALNRAPSAGGQTLSLGANGVLRITIVATDPDGNALTYILVSGPLHGTLSGTFPNLIYTPFAGYVGADSFSFKVNDGTLDSNVAVINLQVLAPNGPPVANDQNLAGDEDTPFIIILTGSAIASDNPVYVLLSQPTHGTLSGTLPNLIYTPNANYNGADSFTFRITSANGQSNVATITLQVLAVNDGPVLGDFPTQFTADNGSGLVITLSASDLDSETLTFVLLSGPLHGTISGTFPNFIYTANPGYLGSDFFTFLVSDGVATTTPTTINLNVGGDAAVKANNDLYTLIIGASDQKQQAGVVLQTNGVFVIGAPGVLRNDSFGRDTTTDVRVLRGPKNGRFLLKNDGTLYYLPNAGKVGVDELTYILSDGKTRATGIVRLNVIDKRVPELRIDTPRDRATVADVTKIAGRARDKNSGLRGLTLLWQRFDGKFWNGREWTARATELPLKLEGINWVYAGSLPKPGTNAARDLLEGRYDLRVTATDNGGNIQRATNRIIVKAPVAISPVRLSSATASPTSLTLRFTGALDAENATDARHYTLLQDGPPLRFVGASYAENSVTLSGLNLTVGQVISLRLEGLRDAAGKTLPSGTFRLTVR